MDEMLRGTKGGGMSVITCGKKVIVVFKTHEKRGMVKRNFKYAI